MANHLNFRNCALVIALGAVCCLTSCDGSQEMTRVNPADFSVRELPILNGTEVTGDDYLSTVGIVYEFNPGEYSIFCTGTLITPNYVLTAGHCFKECEDEASQVEERRSLVRVGIGHSEKTFLKTFEVEEAFVNPGYSCKSDTIINDIAVLKLKEPVALSLAQPTPPLPPGLTITPQEVDSSDGLKATIVGFGKTNSTNELSAGKKYMTENSIYAVCHVSDAVAEKSKKCEGDLTDALGFIFFNSTKTGTCQGDSGGPTFITRDEREYVAGVTSYGFNSCQYVSAMTLVPDYYDFLKKHVDELPAETPEICDNEADDNGDGRIDCDDPYCFSLLRCIPEDCSNKKDDNGDGKVDCEDPQCSELLSCIPEDCQNEVDDNGNGKIDCDDPQCEFLTICQPENCSNGIDDNGNGKIDCDDPFCDESIRCQPEDCQNKKDDNGDGKIDCDDPRCEEYDFCKGEICDDEIDNNGDGKIDCGDPLCSDYKRCQPEICDDEIDNNDDGKIDCDDPACRKAKNCAAEGDGDKKDDAEDEVPASKKKSSDDDCSAAPLSTRGGSGLLSILSLFGVLILRRRREGAPHA